jgi:hypothetical protein
MTSRECYENKWFYMKYIGKYLSGEILLTRECTIEKGKTMFYISLHRKLKIELHGLH